MFSLTVVHKDGRSRVYDFSQAEVTIGRVEGNDIVVPGGNVSKRHARILHNVAKGSFVVIDNKSTNGTTINGERIDAPYDLQPGDKIYIGDFIIEVNPSGAAARGDKTEAGREAPKPKPKSFVPMDGSPTIRAEDSAPAALAASAARRALQAKNAEKATGASTDKTIKDEWEEDEGWQTGPAATPKGKPAAPADDEWGTAAPAATADDGWSPKSGPIPSAAAANSIDDGWQEASSPGYKVSKTSATAANPAPDKPAPRAAPAPTPTPAPAVAVLAKPVIADEPESGPIHRAPVAEARKLSAAPSKPEPAAAPLRRPGSASTAFECLQSYVEIDEHYRLKSFGKPCSCGRCLLCEAKRALEEAGAERRAAGRR